ncbi:hypothetical protein COV18_03640 [Candidatus Woesearchaeota archaeon CG10_big_fil_rev_8_21_14_0_10_37_12]|nr:MAG: hypothetical protein COV18_03640 [Candidatus Woesearchaeota archaeon CG10_big_fil_rev_8_21_14_0_10_37_12]
MRRAELNALLVAVIAIAIGGIVIFVVVPRIQSALEKTQERSECAVSLLRAITTGKHSGSCDTERIYVTKELLNDKKYFPDEKESTEKFASSENAKYRLAAQKLVAEKLVECLSKGWKEKLDLGVGASVTKIFSDHKVGDEYCVLCSELTYAADLQPVIIGDVPLKTMMYTGRTYYDYLTENVENKAERGAGVNRVYISPNETQAVVFIASLTKKRGFETVFVESQVDLLEYSSLTTHLGYTYPSSVLGTRIPAKCKILIGS